MPKSKVYAVRIGRDGPKVYDEWKDADLAVRGYPYAQHKSFQTHQEAERWLNSFVPAPKLSENQILKRLYSQYDRENDQYSSSAPIDKRNKTSGEAVNDLTTLSSNLHNFNNNDINSEVNPNITNSNVPLPLTVEPPMQKVANLTQVVSTPLSSSHAQDFTPANLSPDQANVFRRVLDGRSVFFTGSAGTGKSHLIKLIIKHLRTNTRKVVYVTASTGIAASLIKGTTLHSFAGLGLANDDIRKLIGLVKNSTASKRWREVNVLVIDEVSMIDGNFFDKLNEVAKAVRNSLLPFGGIQLILTGDFFQLPPVTRRGQKRIPYIFETSTWKECIVDMMVLKHVFRQSDQAFVDILNEIRYGEVSQLTMKVMNSLNKEVHYPDGIQPAELYPTQAEVKRANEFHLNKLASPQVLFKSIDRPGEDTSLHGDALRQVLDKNTLIEERLILKVGAQVMLVKNLLDDGLVNGSMGIITGFIDPKQLENWDDNDFQRVDVSKLENDHKGWPKVSFTNGRTKVLRPHDFDVEDHLGNVKATRVQVPLILAWALSIHKSQGQSLDRVKVNLTRSFEAGQVYVALSRATSLESIQVIGFQKSKVVANPIVLDWARKFLD